jgi:hypothetical protein
MKNILKISILLIVLGSCLSVSAQKKKSYFQQKYEDAEVLVNNGLYDVARTYYVDAYRDARATRQNKKVQNQIKEKIVLMDCYSMYFHLLDQSRELEQLLDMESADKYCTDALAYAEYEHLNIPGIDTLKIRSKVLSQTSELCQNLTRVESLNVKGDHASARELFRQVQNKTEMLANDWKSHGFPKSFILKMDSIAHFPNNGRNMVLQYRQVFPDEFKALDSHLYQLLNQKATQTGNSIESDITFVFSLDTNGVLTQFIEGKPVVDRDFKDALSKELRNLQMRQPYRYGFTMPAREELKYHISSSPTDVWVIKSKKEVKIKDSKRKSQDLKEITAKLAKAPAGKYCFQIHRNNIDGQLHTSMRIVRAKGGKANKWLKTL